MTMILTGSGTGTVGVPNFINRDKYIKQQGTSK